MKAKKQIKTLPRQEKIKLVHKNFDYFRENLETIKKDYPDGGFALIRDQKVVEVLDTREDAKKMAHALYEDDAYSIQDIDDKPVDLGFYSHAAF